MEHEPGTTGGELGLERAIRALDERFGLQQPPPTERPVFILSAGWRSGSTLLQRIVASTGQIFMWGEPYDLSGIVQRLAESLMPFDRHWPADAFIYDGQAPRPEEWIANAYPHPRHLIEAQRAFLTRLFGEPAAQAGFDRWGLKEVRLTGEHAYFLRRLYPGAVFLVIHRNPYDAYASYRAHLAEPGRPDPWWWDWPTTPIDSPVAFGRAWNTLAGSLTKWAPTIGAAVIRYDDLAQGKGLDRIEAAIGLPVDPAVLETWVDLRGRTQQPPARRPIPTGEAAELRAVVEPLATELGYAGPPAEAGRTPTIPRRSRVMATLRRTATRRRKPRGNRSRLADRARIARLETRLRRARRRIKRMKNDAGSQWEVIRTTSLRSDGPLPMARVGFFPRGIGSPFARVMYSQFHEHRLEPVPLRQLSSLDDLDQDAVFNLHWTRAAPDDTTDPDVAIDGARAIGEPIRRFVERGGSFLWTIHEPLPHGPDFPEVEIGLRAELSELAHRIHVLHPSTVDAARLLFPIDGSKVFVVEHPLYTGYYPDFTGRVAARRSLGLPDDAYVLLAFGSIRRYKGTERLLHALPDIRRESGRDVRLVVAGWTSNDRYVGELVDLVDSTEGAVIASRGLPDAYVHVVFRAADLTVQPYLEFHNSGVSFLSLTFDCPIVAPRAPVSESLEASGMARLFEPGSDEDLTRVVVDAIGGGFGGPRRPDREFVLRHDPKRLSAEMAGHIISLLGEGSAGQSR